MRALARSPPSWAIGTAIIDMEHGAFECVECGARDHGLQGAGPCGLSRGLTAPERVPIQHALDFGSDGVILPQIADLAHARTCRGFAKYPPLGIARLWRRQDRATISRRPSHFVEAENRRVKCWAMIETDSALAEVEAIAALDTVDGLFIGPNDLSLARGRGEYTADGRDHADIARIASAAERARQALGDADRHDCRSRIRGCSLASRSWRSPTI